MELYTQIQLGLQGKYLTRHCNKPTLYICMDKAFYGTLLVALLFWKDLFWALVKWGFHITPYNHCVAKK